MFTFDRIYKQLLENATQHQKEVTPETLKKCQDLVVAGKTYIYGRYPMVGHVLRRLKVVLTTDNCPTMAVDDVGNIYINPNFGVNELTPKEFVGVLVHEAMHILNMTFPRKKGRNHKLWNIATDYIMNRDIIKDGLSLPKKGCIPEANGDIKVKTKKGEFTINCEGKSAEWLYSELYKVADEDPNAGEGGDPNQPGQPGGMGESLDKHIETKNGQGQPKPIDGTDGPQKNKDMVNEVKKAIQQEQMERQARGLKGKGEGGGAMSNTVLELVEPTVDWKFILRDIMQKTFNEYTWSKPQKRALASGYYAPKNKAKITIHPVCVAIDTSGSIGKRELSVFLSELKSIFNTFPDSNVLLVLWHSNAYFHIQLDKDSIANFQTTVLPKVQSGGTTMSSVADYLNKNGLVQKLKAVIYLTDGQVESAEHLKLIPAPVKNIVFLTDKSTYKDMQKNLNLKVFNIDID